MQDFEKLGLFYLGREYDLAANKPTERLVLYDSTDLVTHAVCVGMTGSGKTGLCLALVEEAVLDGVPVIAIDPKGDLSNLLLTFPHLSPADFRPWINEDDARRRDMAPDAYAAEQAAVWSKGLADWGQTGERIKRLRDAAEFAIYTPGSTAGLPISILSSFAAPGPAILDDGELLSERIATTATSLLTLAEAGDASPRSREHVLLSSIFEAAWKEKRDLDLAALIQQVQAPPMKRVGVMEMDAFYPPKERFELAMRINALLAAPGFQTWFEGEPLDIGRLLHGPSGRPRVSILSIAHLGDAERMFFVSLALNQVLAWTRSQPGTTSLRAILYMDEIYGFFPPVANPPSKPPLITLLKQARAFGVGVVLATQNPVDLDYKGLSNTGTWFLGRLQTERDKMRVLDGLEGAGAARGAFDRGAVEQILAGLPKRVFLMHNVHEEAPVVFQTRWTMSYLRGPLQRDQLRTLTAASQKAAVATNVPPSSGVPSPVASGVGRTADAPRREVSAASASTRPMLPPEIPAYVLPAPGGAAPRYRAALYGSARVAFADADFEVDTTRDVAFVVAMQDGPVPVDWQAAEPTERAPGDLASDPVEGATFGPVPARATKPKSYEGWTKEFTRWLAQSQKLELLHAPALGVASAPGESERDFRIRAQGLMRERRDAGTERIRQKYAARTAALTERVRKAEEAVTREKSEASEQKVQAAVSFGATVLGALFGRKTVSASTIGRATTTARGVGRSMKQTRDIERAGENLRVLQDRLAALEAEAAAEAQAVSGMGAAQEIVVEPVVIRPKRTGIGVQLVTFVWQPL